MGLELEHGVSPGNFRAELRPSELRVAASTARARLHGDLLTSTL